ncbi:hypothetical protein BV898_19896, partial [Hypsibius exemplaris]
MSSSDNDDIVSVSEPKSQQKKSQQPKGPKAAVFSPEEAKKLLLDGTLQIVNNPAAKTDTAVWKKFGLLKADDCDKCLPYAVCRNCKKIYTYKSSHGSGTSTLKYHLQENCTGEASKEGQKRVTQFFQPAAFKEKKPVPTSAKMELSKACVAFTAKDLRAFNTVAGDGFIEIICAAVSIGRRFDFSLELSSELIPHRTTVSQRLGETAKDVRSLLGPELVSVFSEYGGGITLDGWKEVRSQTDYIGLTVHYYLDWKLQERCLLMTEYDREIKTGENIREFVEANLKNPYGVTETLCHNALFVTDG